MPADNPTFVTSPDTLTARERTLLAALVREPTRVVTKRELIARTRIRDTRALDSTALTLQRKLADFDGRRAVLNVWGVGYRYSEPT